MEVQLGFFTAVLDLLGLELRFVLGGVALIGVSLFWLHRKQTLTLKTGIVLAVFYYYLTVMLSHIVGIPTIKEFIRLSALGESIWNPNINLVPLADGFSLEFLLNICCFVPLGFFCPMISRAYEKVQNVLLLGFGFSLVIEISQLFTLYRATDISDLIANTLGAFIGYLCFKGINKLTNYKLTDQNHTTFGLPIVYLAFAFIITFIQI